MKPWVRAVALLAVAFVAAGCTVRAVKEAPIEDKSVTPRTSRPAPIANAPAPAPAAPVAGPREAANGNYVVQRGDTLYSIAIAFGHDYRDIARWNNLDDPTKIAVGQSLRVAPPEGETPAAAVVGVVNVNPSAPTETRPLDAVPVPAPPQGSPLPANPASPPPTTAPTPSPATVPQPTPAPAAPAPPAPEPKTAPPATAGLLWQWPAKGKVIEGFAEGRNKGIDIGGAEGDAVLSAGDGEVVYTGSSLRTYGNLVIVKHNDDYISAYGHNKQILVKQGDSVRRGQRIAQLGKADDGNPKLHFEIRYKGKAVDPAKILPPAR